MPEAYLAIDLGASSGRAIVGVFDADAGRLTLEEVHRFAHVPCPTPTGPVWDLTGIWRETLAGLAKASAWCKEQKVDLRSIGVDTWGVDWVAVGEQGELLSLAHCYRDPRNEPAAEAVIEKLGGFDQLYQRTGIQRMPFNTIFQLAASHAAEPRLLESTGRVLLLPDLLHYWLSGEQATEHTIASTTSMLTAETGEWDTELLNRLGLPTDVLAPLVQPGTDLGALLPEVAEHTGAPATLRVVTPAAHDTASAVVAAPAMGGDDWAYLSSGTWSLVGVEATEPVLTPAAREAPLTHERGPLSTYRLLKNISGLWPIQLLRAELAEHDPSLGFDHLVADAEEATPLVTLVNPDDSRFASPGPIASRLKGYAKETGQPEPESPGALARCCLESLALSYRHTLDNIGPIVGRQLDTLHIVGGGVQNELLNRLAAAATGRHVTAGPVEATTIGNVLMQAVGLGRLPDLAAIRQVVRDSFDVVTVEAPAGNDPIASDATRERFARLLTHS